MTVLDKLLQGAQALNDACDTIATQGKALDDYIQFVGLSAIHHVELHGDVTVINRLYRSMPKGSRRSALSEWLLMHAKVVANTGPNKKEAPFNFDRARQTFLEGAEQRPWFDFKPDKAPDQCFDLYAALQSLLGRAKKAGQVSDPAALAELEGLAGRVKPAAPAVPEALMASSGMRGEAPYVVAPAPAALNLTMETSNA